jgi:hypothetical protein
MDIRITDFRYEEKNTRKGYFTLIVDGLMVKKCVAHKHPGGKIWFAPPAVQKPDGGYENVVCFSSPTQNDEAQRRVADLLRGYIEKAA